MIATAAVAAEPHPVKYGEPVQVCTLQNKRIKESSGVACSRLAEGVFWTHNDSGDGPRVYAFNEEGHDLATLTVTGVRFADCEDMCSFTLKKGARRAHYLLLADVGDNGAKRKVCRLYLVREPALEAKERGATVEAKPDVAIRFMYADGPHDCESVGVDPVREVILLVTKRGSERYVYEIPIPNGSPPEVLRPERIATLRIPTTLAMDVSPDGRRAMILSGGRAAVYSRGADESWAAAFAREPRMWKRMPPRRQGESICYGPDGWTIFLTSEGLPTPLWRVPTEGTPPPLRGIPAEEPGGRTRTAAGKTPARTGAPVDPVKDKAEREAARLYWLARRAENMGQPAAAASFYEKMLAEYPHTRLAGRAAARLTLLRK